MNCEDTRQHELAERYLQQSLSDAEQGAYEQHYFACDRCFADLQLLQSVQTRLLAGNPRHSPRHDASRYWPWVAVLTAAGLAGLAVLLVRGPAEDRVAQQPPASSAAPTAPGAEPASLPQSTAAAPAASSPQVRPARDPAVTVDRASALRRLARVEAPRYVPRQLRGPASPTDQQFAEALQFYVAGDYTRASNLLAVTASLDPDRNDVAFYLGAASLLSGDTHTAQAALQRVVARGDGRYLEDTRFLLAKLRLGESDLAAARRELESVLALQGERESEARELLRQLQALPPD